MGFVFNGKSSDNFGLAVKTIKAPVLAAPRYEEVEIPGRDGAYKFFQGFKSTEAILELTVVGELKDRQTKIKQIKDWLKGTANLKIDYCEAFEATVMNIDTSNFENATEVIRVTFKSGSSAGSSVPGGGAGAVYDDTELRNLIANKVDKVEGKGLSEANFTQEEKVKLAGLSNGGSAIGNIDGGYPDSVYGGLEAIDGGGI